jgi:hypothetical protein
MNPKRKGTREAIRIKQRLARTLLGKARRWEDPGFMSFVSDDRRRANIFTLRVKARQLERDVAELERYSRHGAPGGREL